RRLGARPGEGRDARAAGRADRLRVPGRREREAARGPRPLVPLLPGRAGAAPDRARGRVALRPRALRGARGSADAELRRRARARRAGPGAGAGGEVRAVMLALGLVLGLASALAAGALVAWLLWPERAKPALLLAALAWPAGLALTSGAFFLWMLVSGG